MYFLGVYFLHLFFAVRPFSYSIEFGIVVYSSQRQSFCIYSRLHLEWSDRSWSLLVSEFLSQSDWR